MNQNNIAAKREQEKRIVSLMIRTYCRGHHGTRQGLCPECQTLQEYALLRADRCPFIETKTFCSNCRVHCYKARHAGKNPCCYAVFRTAYAVQPPGTGRSARHREYS